MVEPTEDASLICSVCHIGTVSSDLGKKKKGERFVLRVFKNCAGDKNPRLLKLFEFNRLLCSMCTAES